MIYHIALAEDWQRCQSLNDYFPVAFRTDGFTHASQSHQVKKVLERHFAGIANLMLLTIDEKKLRADLLYEPAADGEIFPHIYGAINKSCIVSIDEGADFIKAVNALY